MLIEHNMVVPPTGDGADCEFRLAGSADLSRDYYVQLEIQSHSDLITHHHASARHRQHERTPIVFLPKRFSECTSGVLSILERANWSIHNA